VADPKPDEPTPPSPKSRRPGRAALPVITGNRFDVLVLLVLSTALFLSMILFTILAIVSKESAISSKLADALAYICMLSIGAIGGRLTGKTSEPDRLEAGEKK
jgi:hypothetical protein